jgi:predicted Rossmann fold flavoprotein
MRIAIIGGGAAGLYSAIALKKKNPEAEISIYEKEEKAARKLYATGNGHCNLLNAALAPQAFNHPEILKPYLAVYPFHVLEETLKDWGIETLHEGDYVYPLSYSAATYVGFLTKLALALKIRLFLNARFLDYFPKDGGFAVKFDLNSAPKEVQCDRLVFALGGASQSRLGSDGKSVSVFAQHGYSIVPFEPGLAPIKVRHPERLKGLAGYRHAANVRLVSSEGQPLYEEAGEVLFKEDGLSGIVIFNVESVYLRLGKPAGATLHLDYFPAEKAGDLLARLTKARALNPNFYGDAFFPSEIQPHFSGFSAPGEIRSLVAQLKDDVFEIKGTYGFEHSQVSVGGIALNQLDSHLESRHEKGVYFVGEMVDIDGICGGFNLSWALISALIVRDNL